MHKSYIEKLKHPCDFKVKYKFYSEEEGGRKTLPFQGIRSDFYYEHKDHLNINEVFMIWPEFENENGQLIESGPVLKEGIARMWIILKERREYHQAKISIGTIGFFREGARSTGICEVVEIIGLHSNPTM